MEQYENSYEIKYDKSRMFKHFVYCDILTNIGKSEFFFPTKLKF